MQPDFQVAIIGAGFQATDFLAPMTLLGRDLNDTWRDGAEVQDRFNRDVQARLRDTVWGHGCESWYKTASGKNTNNRPGFTFQYRRRTRRLDPRHYELHP